MTTPDDATIKRWIDNQSWPNSVFNRATVQQDEEIALRRELLTLRSIVRAVAADGPNIRYLGEHGYECEWCSYSVDFRHHLLGPESHAPTCRYRLAVEWASQHEEATS